MKKYDAIIIGSGQGGTPLAKKLAKAGWKTALLEKRFIGGTCINDGCTPTKTMVASARMAWLAGHSRHLGVTIPAYKINMPTIIKRKDKIVESFRNGSQKGLEETKNLTIIYGEASFVSSKIISIIHNKTGNAEKLEGKYIFINTGTDTTIPPIEGIGEIEYFTNTSILESKIIPEHLLVIGGSYIGLEFGQMFKRFGSKITIVEAADTFLGREDKDIADNMFGILQDEGLKIHVNTKATHFSKTIDGIKVKMETGGKLKTITCSHVLIAAGRHPQTKNLQLQNAGIKMDDRGYIHVNNRLETSVKNIYAFGDVKGGPAFTHIAYNDQLVIVKNLLENGKATISNRLVPYCMFTDPQLGRVGITEKEAVDAGKKIKVATLPMKHVARAIEAGDTRGMMKAIVDAKTNMILGAACIGEQGGEIMTVLQMAMMGKITATTIRNTAIAHPLYAESLNNLFMTLDK